MSANVSCPHCSGLILNDPRIAGREVGCPHCTGRVLMPGTPSIPPQPKAALPAIQDAADPLDFLNISPPIAPGHRRGYRDHDIGFTLRTRNCTMAYVSLTLVCLSFVTAGLLLLPGIVCGHIALNQCNRDRHMVGRSYAVAALTVGYIVLGIAALIIISCVGLISSH